MSTFVHFTLTSLCKLWSPLVHTFAGLSDVQVPQFLSPSLHLRPGEAYELLCEADPSLLFNCLLP